VRLVATNPELRPETEAVLKIFTENRGPEVDVLVEDAYGNRASVLTLLVDNGMLAFKKVVHYAKFNKIPVRHLGYGYGDGAVSEIYELRNR
jgi:hypothetical protein